ncbi:MAG: phenylacetate--CoA ligase family protein [Alphaproteobacteria bacterium]
MELHYLEPEHERADRATIRALQWRKIRALVEKAWARNAFYRDHWAAAGVDPARLRSLEDFTAAIPVVRKRDFMADQERAPPFGRRAAWALAKRGPLMVCTTSGTTGQGVEVHAQTRDEAAIAHRVYGYLFRWAGLEPGDAVFLNFPITMLGGGRIEFHGLEAYGLTVFPVGNYDVQRKLDLMRRFRPKAVMATTSYLGHLAAASGERPPPGGVEVLFGGGEGGGYAWFERLEEQWAARFDNHFGATQTRVDHMFSCERGIGTRGHPSMLHNIDPYFLLEVVDPATGRHVADGEAGEIVLTSLFHDDIPLIRCAMSDRAVYHEPAYCPCGRPFAGVEIGTISRMDDMKKVKGVNIWPQAVDDLLFHIPEVDEYQIVLTSSADESDVATARIMPKTALAPARAKSLAEEVGAKLRERIGIRFGVELLPEGALARSEYKARRWVDERTRMK